jgi:hypothetical protein
MPGSSNLKAAKQLVRRETTLRLRSPSPPRRFEPPAPDPRTLEPKNTERTAGTSPRRSSLPIAWGSFEDLQSELGHQSVLAGRSLRKIYDAQSREARGVLRDAARWRSLKVLCLRDLGKGYVGVSTRRAQSYARSEAASLARLEGLAQRKDRAAAAEEITSGKQLWAKWMASRRGRGERV